ncbi:hypothetical protein [Pedobacter antarcticus]|uniref:hypothetical protein n=1 Tax=Pedobacter antarcticus TaxID=34086 RepID=UPI0009436AA9|nr:hypothetical protein [Pedobacter antarcticus]
MNTNSQEYQHRKQLAMKAHRSGCVIFSPETQKYYTPREFLDSNEVVKYIVREMVPATNFDLMKPKIAIKKKLEELNKTESEFQDFLRRMMSAFEMAPKTK